jgi:CheY-like chemotaxis protein/nitrogen-specific signal transduction histidine kinase
MLSDQKSQLEQHQVQLAAKADELERVNQYKSEFLANMSHELRTPLNSSLIFAKLLADNKDGNLSAEQVRYAETIGSAGNDLLALINDILDLSKIEAGKMDVSIASIAVAPLAENIIKGFVPLAEQRNLQLTLKIGDDAPEHLQTDAQRLGQILKNLISNALKFTDSGSVTLQVRRHDANNLSFDVIDTGIGVPKHQQAIIFEAFRQADGSTHRRHGGTGLGLSISRDLAHLLGGALTVNSEENRGSTFTLTLPLEFSSPQPLPATIPAAPAPVAVSKNSAATRAKTLKAEPKTTPARRLLIIEDDAAFASILADLSTQCGFEGVVMHTARDGLMYALDMEPSAILLDMNLPDEHGLNVLDELKRNPATRHIPVHIISVDDYTYEALGRGAIGYALKPVRREELMTAIRKLEEKLAQQLHRVLVVEDDARQLHSIRHLLSADDVEITGVTTAQAALAQLQETTFDCMVMDLKLPDFSGYELLQRMADSDDIAFPPVIIYTGRLLTRDEEQQLRRFSKSIIIKDARSPERLLDEVTLFLHQVESALPLERQRMLKLARHRESAFEGRRILVVEDDARNIFALTSILEPKGAMVEIARNGREAIDVLTRYRQAGETEFDAVLMDIMMPEMDGYTAMRKIREAPHWKKLPIIALTAKAMKDDQEKCLEAGANDYISKPLDVDKLLSLLRVWMTNA